ncbi:MarC family protein [Lentisphaerota bacterium ZTH]|nr:NAAT family transporter [Lentisphaerota bacterium]WET06808.1 MarC family protein [Lentisphaerota bacterium ZTH]
MNYIIKTAILLFLVMGAFSNLPIFMSVLKDVPHERRRFIIIRESLVALVVLTTFLVFGRSILDLMQISQSSLGIAGGIILFMIAIKMIFGQRNENGVEHKGEPFIVPLAIPILAGPSAVAVIILLRGNPHLTFAAAGSALLLAWIGSTTILLSSLKLHRFLSRKVLSAAEALMGLILTAISIEMLLRGVKTALSS